MSYDQAANLLELFRRQGYVIRRHDEDSVVVWDRYVRETKIDPELMESVECLVPEILDVLKRESDARQLRGFDRTGRARRKWKPKRNDR